MPRITDKTMTRLYLLRHGETDYNLQKRYFSRTDVALDATGETQARDLRKRFKDIDVDAVYTSVAVRARRTAEIVFAGRKIKTQATSLLAEMDFGEWEGLTYEEICYRDKERYGAWLENPSAVSPPQGESLADVTERVESFIKKVRRECRGRTAAVVSHAGTIKTMLCSVLGVPLEAVWRLSVDLASVSVVDYYSEKPYVRLVNDTCHLAGLRV